MTPTALIEPTTSLPAHYRQLRDRRAASSASRTTAVSITVIIDGNDCLERTRVADGIFALVVADEAVGRHPPIVEDLGHTGAPTIGHDDDEHRRRHCGSRRNRASVRGGGV
jgi:hypothetical protein